MAKVMRGDVIIDTINISRSRGMLPVVSGVSAVQHHCIPAVGTLIRCERYIGVCRNVVPGQASHGFQNVDEGLRERDSPI